MYRPISSSILQRFMAWVSGTHPEFFDTKFVAQGEGREVTRVTNTGVVKVTISIMTKGMESFGYSTGGGGTNSNFVTTGGGGRCRWHGGTEVAIRGVADPEAKRHTHLPKTVAHAR